MEEIMLKTIRYKGYCTQKEIFMKMSVKYVDAFLKKHMKPYMEEIMNIHGMERVRSNKELKELYGISSMGYPYIVTFPKHREIKNDVQ